MLKVTENVVRRAQSMAGLLIAITTSIEQAISSGAKLNDIKHVLNDLISIVLDEEN